VSFADPTIHEATNISRNPDCYSTCIAWNAARPRTAVDNCTIGVHFGGNNTCAIKATAARPFHTDCQSTDSWRLTVLANAIYCQARHEPDPRHMSLIILPNHMSLIILPNKNSVDHGAVSLDGTAPGIYFRAANTTAELAARTKWVMIVFQGWRLVLHRTGLSKTLAHNARLVDWAGAD
jgi:hypothetical protein